MDYDLIPLLSDLLFKTCAYWVIVVVVVIVYLSLSKLLNWRWDATELGEENDA